MDFFIFNRNQSKISQGYQAEISHKKDASTSCHDNTVSVNLQCEPAPRTTTTQHCPGLQDFKINPIIERELALPLVPMDRESSVKEPTLMSEKSIQLPISTKGKRILVAWVSINPLMLALSFTPLVHRSYCDHPLEQVLVVTGNRDLPVALTIPIRACASVLYASEHVKDVLAVGTVLGDLIVWKLQRGQEGTYACVELLSTYHGDDGTITTLNWFKSINGKTMLIGGQPNGIDTWSYDERHQRILTGKSYVTESSASSVLNPILIVETISETSFCLYRRGCPPTIYDINNCKAMTKNKSSAAILIAGKECKGIDPLLEIDSMRFISDQSHKYENNLIVTSRQGDIFIVRIHQGAPDIANCLYRMANLNTKGVVLFNRLDSYAMVLKFNGDLELVNVTSGKAYPCTVAAEVEHISMQSNDDRLLTWCGQQGKLEIFTVVSEE